MLIEHFVAFKRIIVLIFFTFCLPKAAFSRIGDSLFYDIKLTIKGIKSPKLLFGYYVGEQTYLIDSTQVDLNSSSLRFKSNRPLAEGVYFVANTEGILFDLILAGEADFIVSTNITAPYDSAHITNSVENRAYFDYMKMSNLRQNEVRQLQSTIDMLRRAKADKATLYDYQLKIREKYESLEAYTLKLIQDNPTLLVSKLLRLSTTPSVPSEVSPIAENRKPNPVYWFYFRNHFFDCVDFTDKRLLRSYHYTKRLEQFLGYMPVNPDSVKSHLDFVLEKTRTNPDFYKYTLNWLTALFDNNLEKMKNADAYLVHLVEKYHRNMDSGTDKYVLERLDYKVSAFKNVLIGSPAPKIELPNASGAIQSVHDIKTDYTLVVFYSSLCSHCKTAMPKLKNILQYVDTSRITIYTICTDAQREPWLSFIDELKIHNWVNVLDSKHESDIQKRYVTWNLPVLYLLDKDKNIVANRVKIENLPDLLRGTFDKQ